MLCYSRCRLFIPCGIHYFILFSVLVDPWGYDSVLSVGSWEIAKGIQLRHDDIQQQLNDPTLQNNVMMIAKLSKELHSLTNTAELVKDIEKKRQELQQLQQLQRECQQTIQTVHLTTQSASASGSSSSSSSLSQSINDSITEAHSLYNLATDEYNLLLPRLLSAENELLDHLLPSAADNSRNAILEVRAGTGGDEAALFARDIFHMYENYAHRQGWTWEILSISDGDLGGYKEASVLIGGVGVFGSLKYETGVHRVQRIPLTESQGRVHTSAMTVAVLPEAEEFDIIINESRDLRIDVYRSGGKGGQSVNTTDSAVRVTHIPTGTVVAIQDERSQIQNKAKALRILRSKLYEQQRQREQQQRIAMRSSQIGHGERNERIRTYNYNQGRVTDHRINMTKYSMEKMMLGEYLDEFMAALKHQERLQQIQAMNEI